MPQFSSHSHDSDLQSMGGLKSDRLNIREVKNLAEKEPVPSNSRVVRSYWRAGFHDMRRVYQILLSQAAKPTDLPRYGSECFGHFLVSTQGAGV